MKLKKKHRRNLSAIFCMLLVCALFTQSVDAAAYQSTANATEEHSHEEELSTATLSSADMNSGEEGSSDVEGPSGSEGSSDVEDASGSEGSSDVEDASGSEGSSDEEDASSSIGSSDAEDASGSEGSSDAEDASGPEGSSDEEGTSGSIGSSDIMDAPIEVEISGTEELTTIAESTEATTEMDKPVVVSDCTCTTACSVLDPNPDCVFCSTGLNAADCKAGPCTCTKYCNPDVPNKDCAFCMIDINAAFCKGKKCTCIAACSISDPNKECAFCAVPDNASECDGCICITACDPLNPDPDCVFCNTDLNVMDCQGCTCIKHCNPADPPNPKCAYCKKGLNILDCKGSCTCNVLCDVENPDPNCKFCIISGNAKLCAGSPCICFISCPAGSPNPDCASCMAGRKCNGLICSCDIKCDSSSINEECIRCQYLKESYCDGTGSRTAEDIQQAIDNGNGQIMVKLTSKTIMIDRTLHIPDGKQVMITHDNRVTSFSEHKLIRDVGYNWQPLFTVEGGGSLTLDKNITVDGNGGVLTSYAPLFQVENGGRLILDGCTVTSNENRGGNGGGIYAADGSGLVVRNGAAVTDCEAVYGGGIYLEQGARMEVSGNIQITGNYADTAHKNVCIAAVRENAPLYIENGGIYGSAIGISVQDASAAYPFAYKESAVTTEDSDAFYCDDEAMEIIRAGNGLTLSPFKTSVQSGRVLLDGKAVENVLVAAKSRQTGRILYKTYTGRDGSFSLQIPESETSVRILATSVLEGNGRSGNFAAIAEHDGKTADTIELKCGRIVCGTVAPTDGMPESQVDGAALSFQDSNGNPIENTQACYGGGNYDALLPDSDGDYAVVVQTLDGRYSGSGNISVIGSRSKGMDLTMREGSVITGTLLRADKATPSTGSLVVLTNTADIYGTRMQMLSADFVPEGNSMMFAVTDANGKFKIGGINRASRYDLIAVSADGSETVAQPGGLIPNHMSISLEQTKPATGKALYIKEQFGVTGAESPQQLCFEVKTPEGFRIRVPIDKDTGEFTFNLPDGDYELDAVSTQDSREVISGNGAVLTIDQGTYDLGLADSEVAVNNPLITVKNFTTYPFPTESSSSLMAVNKNAPGNSIIVQMTAALSEVWLGSLEQLYSIPLDNFDPANPDHMTWLREGSDGYKSLTNLERDMLPWELVFHMRVIYDRLANQYKVTVKNNNQFSEGIKAFRTGLGDEAGATDAGRRIGYAEGMSRGKEDSALTIQPTIRPATSYEKQEVIAAISSGTVLECFDITLRGRFEDDTKDFYISALTEPIEVDIALTQKQEAGDCKVLRIHDGAVTALDAEYDAATGTYSFETDRFSTYAVVTSQPGKGIVISETPSENPQPGEGNSGSSSGHKSTGSSSEKASYDNQYDFWSSIQNRIAKAAAGTAITLDASGYNKIPSYIIAALANKDVTLIIHYGDGQTMALNGLKITAGGSKLYYTLDELSQAAVEVPEAVFEEATQEVETQETGGEAETADAGNITEKDSQSDEQNLLIAGAGNFPDQPPKDSGNPQSEWVDKNPVAEAAVNAVTQKTDTDNIIPIAVISLLTVGGGAAGLFIFLRKRSLFIFRKK